MAHQPRYTHEQAQMYEIARDVINAQIGRVSSAIGREEGKENPDQAVIVKLEQEQLALVVEREDLHVQDDAKAREIIAKYARRNVAGSGVNAA